MALTKPFAEHGDKLEIPQTASDSSVSYDQGFTYAYARPPEEGGKFIDRAQFNQLMYDTTSQVLANKTAIATKANSSEVVKLTGAQKIAGVKTFTNDIVSPNITAMQNNLNTIFSSTSSPVKAQTTTKTITVGTSGDFANLSQAFYEAKKYTSPVTIKLISNLNINAAQNILYVNGAHIILDFNDFKIINTNKDVNVSLNFIGCHIGAITKINLEDVIFGALSGSLVYIQDSVNIINGNSPGADCIRAWYGSYIGIADNTTMNFNHGANRFSIYSSVGSIIGIGGDSTINDNSANGTVLNAYRGGIIQITGVTINATSAAIANQAANTPTMNGIIFGNYSL